VRNNVRGEFMVIVVVGEERDEWLFPLLDEIKNNFPEVVSLHYIISTKVNDTIFDQEVINYSGDAFITETMENLNFQISPKSFFQTNPTQALELYKVVREFSALTGNEVVYDLYTGTGSIALFVAAQSKMVIGIEQVEDSIRDARLNAQLNNISNVKFFTSDLRHALTPKFVSEHGKPDVIITDPPRAGMHPDVVRELLNTEAKRIVYVSCNPASQARDLNTLAQKYALMKIQPVDMFPHTHHIENVAMLELI
jgi:23S rRNA (uracil1939-C5)-methyltransferase